jgi:5-hydroxyisourate hydrolase
MSRISTHVLDTALGRPAAGVMVLLEYADLSGQWQTLSALQTDADGRCSNLLPQDTEQTLRPGQYRLRFETGEYHAAQSVQGLYPMVEITVTVRPEDNHLHVPLLLSPNGYTTYRGS